MNEELFSKISQLVLQFREIARYEVILQYKANIELLKPFENADCIHENRTDIQ